MKMFVEPARIYLHRDAVDIRKSIDGLVALVESELERDAYTGALFLFCNKAKDKLKLVYWDKTGFALWYKRLEKQKFKWPSKVSLQEFELSPEQLDWLLSSWMLRCAELLSPLYQRLKVSRSVKNSLLGSKKPNQSLMNYINGYSNTKIKSLPKWR